MDAALRTFKAFLGRDEYEAVCESARAAMRRQIVDLKRSSP
jgi:hypothetical protein